MIQHEVFKLDLSEVTSSMISRHGWSEDEAQDAEKLYRNFLFLVSKYSNKTTLVPSHDIDMYWHEHILFTKKYFKDCDSIFGSYFHHDPSLTADGAGDLRKLFDNTQELHNKEFGYYIYDVRVSMMQLTKEIFKRYFGKLFKRKQKS